MAPRNHKKEAGFAAILGLLIVVAIGLLIYFADIKAIFGTSGIKSGRKTPADAAWTLESLLIPENGTVGRPLAGQYQIEKPLAIAAGVTRGKDDKGTLKMRFTPDGRVAADWNAQIDQKGQTMQYQSRLAGNIVPDYAGSEGSLIEDKTQLFFMASGRYRQITQPAGQPKKEEFGTAYLLGTLAPDGQIQGTLTITTDRSWSAVFEYNSQTNASGTD